MCPLGHIGLLRGDLSDAVPGDVSESPSTTKAPAHCAEALIGNWVDLVQRYSNPGAASVEADRLRTAVRLTRELPLGCSPRVTKPTHVHKAVQRLTPDQLLDLIADYEAGAPSTELMQKYGLGKGTVLNLLREHGVNLRCQGLNPALLQEAADRYRSGWSLTALGREYRCDAETIRKELRAVGVRMRRPWERS